VTLIWGEDTGLPSRPSPGAADEHAVGPSAAAFDEVGDWLLRSGAIDEERLDFARAQSRRSGQQVGDILVAYEIIPEEVLVAALCELHGLQPVGLVGAAPDPVVAHSLPRDLSLAWRIVPVAITLDRTVLLAAARPLDPPRLAEVERLVGHPVEQLLASRKELDELIQQVNAEHFTEVARTLLRDTAPEFSADVVITPMQKGTALAVVLVVIVALVVAAIPTLITLVGLASVFYLFVSVYKFWLTMRSLGTRLEMEISAEDIAALNESDLPPYTILVPLYREGGVVPNLVRGLNELNYPRTLLDIKLLCEEDDDDTIATIRALDLPPQFRLVVVPNSLPKTKPKACNYGLQFATGEYCVIFDAEDRPDPDQLKKAVIAFRRLSEDVVCVQAKLNHFNQHQNMLTAWFANEYAMHFELILPAMASSNSPIPLGGTSNHFVTSTLRELGAWDPFNVTEDADLGLRLHRAGYRTAMIDSTTLEEANSAVGNWIRQRSRWNKGYLQTWLVHMRHPLELLRETGLRGFISINLTLGSAFVLLLNPVFWFLTTFYVFVHLHLIQQIFPGVIYYVGSTMLFVGNFVFLFLNVAGGLQRGQFDLTRTALLSPFYWGLMSWAAWKGFIQLFTNPFYWEKTEHGLDQPETNSGTRWDESDEVGLDALFGSGARHDPVRTG
jgi:cellulose synthase/poly-beta-1,6-N-acetylglucosamine synthase-like glycosyltransferase